MDVESDELAILLPYQRRWMADQARVKVCEKSRRIGITWTEAADRALCASIRGGMDAWYIGYNKEMAAEFIEAAAGWARRFNQAAAVIEEIAVADESRDIMSYRIRFASGHKIVALSSRPSNLRGKQGCAVIDEAAFHDNLNELLKASLAFTIWGGMVRVISTHNGADSAFYELVENIKAERLSYSLHRITFEDALADGLYRRICEVQGEQWSPEREAGWRAQVYADYGDSADEELLCVARHSGGVYLPSVLVEGRMRADAPVLRWELDDAFALDRSEEARRRECEDWCRRYLDPIVGGLDPNLLHCFGEDFGRSGDLSVIWPIEVGQDLVRRTPVVIEMRNVPFKQQEQVLFYLLDRMPRLAAGAMDARGNGQYLAEQAALRYGRRVEAVMLSEGWYRDNMPRYKAAFEDGTIEIPRDADVLADHRAIIMERGIARAGDARGRGADGKPRHADTAIAGALAFYASGRDGGTDYSYTPVRIKPPAEAGAAAFKQIADYDWEEAAGGRAARVRNWSGF